MFGYITANMQELTSERKERYQSMYCGLCSTLQKRYGLSGRVTLSYDTTFLLMLLSSLYEPEEINYKAHCIVHPTKLQPFTKNDISEYVADMNIALAYFKCMDDWNDDKSLTGLTQAKLLKKAYNDISEKYPRQCKAFEESLSNISRLEHENCENVDMAANQSGRMFAEMFVYKKDWWEPLLRSMGGALGRFVYFMDAYEDLPGDIRHKRYNPLGSLTKRSDYEGLMRESLTMLIAECTEAFELLPLQQDVDILRNILYSGVWAKYTAIQNKASRKDAKMARKENNNG